MNDLNSLNKAQRVAAEHTTGPLLVVAGAGTGKTKVITSRIANLITTKLAQPGEILALTFTEKAASEMSERLSNLLGWEALGVPVMTFNAFGASLLGEYGSHIGRNTRGGLLNDTQKSLLLLQRYDQIKLKYYGPQVDTYGFLVGIITYIGKLQNAGISAQAYSDYAARLEVCDTVSSDDIAEQHDLVNFYTSYELAKQETGTFDYYDQLALPLEILQSKPHIAARLQKRFRFILVDEYQDTSPVQDALLRELVPPGGNLFAVGDDDQAIYGFRGADISNIREFTQHYQVELPVALVENYRSGQAILDAAYQLIEHNNPERLEPQLGLDKRLIAATQTPARVTFNAYRSPSDELNGVIDDIRRRLNDGARAADMAVLARSNMKLREYARELRERGIAYAISTAVNIFEQRELLQLWHLLCWIGGRAKDEAIGNLMVGPYFNVPVSVWRNVTEEARSAACGLEAALRTVAQTDVTLAESLQRLDAWRAWAGELGIGELAYQIVFKPVATELPLGLTLQQRAGSANGQTQLRIFRVFEDLARLFTQMNDYMSVQELGNGDRSLAGYLAVFPVRPTLEVSETDGDADGVALLTVHASKGLEFPVVYVVNTTERSWSEPASMGANEVPTELQPDNLTSVIHEQRRLMYVAATRAKSELIVSAPVASEGGQKQRISQLVTELFGHDPEINLPEQITSKQDKVLQKIHRFAPMQDQLPDRLPYERDDGWIHMGVSDLYSYSLDPHAFMLEKVLRISRSSSWKAGFGVLIHATIQRYFEGLRDGAVPAREELLEMVRDGWKHDGFDSVIQSEAAFELARATVRRFYEREQIIKRLVRAVEHPISLDIPEAKLRLFGRIDALFETEGGLEIRDFKTGDRRDDEKLAKLAKDSFQLRTYALTLLDLTGAMPAQVTLDYVVTGHEGSAELTPAIMKNHREKLITLATSLRQRDFSPKAGSPGFPNIAAEYYGEGDDIEA